MQNTFEQLTEILERLELISQGNLSLPDIEKDIVLEKMRKIYAAIQSGKAPKAQPEVAATPEKYEVYQGLEEMYSTYGNISDLVAFYKSQLPGYKKNARVVGNLYFYMANICLDIDKAIAKDYFLQARESFRKVYGKDHYVFGVIEEALKSCEQ